MSYFNHKSTNKYLLYLEYEIKINRNLRFEYINVFDDENYNFKHRFILHNMGNTETQIYLKSLKLFCILLNLSVKNIR